MDGNQRFCSDPVAPALAFLAGDFKGLRVGKARTTQPEMGELMREGEHLCCLGVPSVDEDQWRNRIRQREPSKLLWVETASAVAADHAADHDEYAKLIRLPDEASKGVGPGWDSPALRDVEAEKAPHAGRDFGDVVLGSGGPHEIDRFSSCGPHELAIPVLPLLAEVDGVEQIRARVNQPRVGTVEIGNRTRSTGRLREEKMPTGRERRLWRSVRAV